MVQTSLERQRKGMNMDTAAPQCITDLVPRSDSWAWSQPEFSFIEDGLLFYKTSVCTNAGGCKHTIYFPVNPNRRTLYAQEKWGRLADDAVKAVEAKTIRSRLFTSGH